MHSQTVALLVAAAGRGTRLGAERPKQYLPCAGRPLIAHTLEALAAAWPFSAVIVVIHADDRALYDESARASFAGRPGDHRAACDRRRDAAAERARRARGARLSQARPRAHPRCRTPLSVPRAHRAERSKRPRGMARRRRERRSATRSNRSTPRAGCWRPRRARASAPCRRRRRSASASFWRRTGARRRRRRRPHRRRRGRRMGRRAGLRVRGRSR